jgi:hypothetical protein
MFSAFSLTFSAVEIPCFPALSTRLWADQLTLIGNEPRFVSPITVVPHGATTPCGLSVSGTHGPKFFFSAFQ